ncbi:MAG: CvpA family protein [Aquificae bacterium]|nr:CvpA family protein [Aquificota bacterium]
MADLILGVLFLYLVLVGAYRGFVELFLKSAGIGIGVFLAFKYTPSLSAFLSFYFNTAPPILNFLAFSLIIISVLAVSHLVYVFLKKTLSKKKRFSLWDRLIGASGGILIFLILVALISHYSAQNRLVYELTASSKIISFFKR